MMSGSGGGVERGGGGREAKTRVIAHLFSVKMRKEKQQESRGGEAAVSGENAPNRKRVFF